MEQFKANARDSGIIVLKYQSDGESCFLHFKDSENMLLQKNNLIDTHEPEVIIKMDLHNKLFGQSWVW